MDCGRACKAAQRRPRKGGNGGEIACGVGSDGKMDRGAVADGHARTRESPTVSPAQNNEMINMTLSRTDPFSALINGQQIVVAKYLYDPFGNVLSIAGPMALGNVYRFSSKEYDQKSGLTYYLYRFYDPTAQRWLNGDPIQEWGGPNLYECLSDDPVDLIDAFGLACCDKKSIDAEKTQLLKNYASARSSLESRSVPHHGCGQYSCDSVNYPVLNSIGNNLKCWKCREERRSHYFANHWWDHWAVVCVPNDGGQPMLFDYWGDRPAGENPAVWFDKTYNVPGLPGSAEMYHYPGPNGPNATTSPPAPTAPRYPPPLFLGH